MADGVYNVAEMQRHTEAFVRNELFRDKPLPSRLCRKFYPTRRDYTNIMYRTRVSQLHSRVDQENLLHKIDSWQAENADNRFFFRPYMSSAGAAAGVGAGGDDDDDDVMMSRDDGDESDGGGGGGGLLLVYQSAWQRRLLARYGCLCLLDATYKTTRYAVPLFFLCVRTNVDYIVVATFVTQFEDRVSIAEAINIIRDWSTDWQPKSFMVDFCDAEINALEQLFPGWLWCLLFLYLLYKTFDSLSCYFSFLSFPAARFVGSLLLTATYPATVQVVCFITLF